MASAELAVARAGLSAALFRPDPKPCSREDIEHFLSLLASATSHCSPANVQKCKYWALEHLVPSQARVGAFGKYLRALSKSVAAGDASRPSAKRKRLHILYIVNDILFHTTQRAHDASFSKAIEGHLAELFESASSFSNSPKHIGKVRDLIDIWRDNEYYAPGFLRQLDTITETGPLRKASETVETEEWRVNGSSAGRPTREAPFLMPSMHGDPTTPWYDLPAGNWLPVLEPNSTRPMNPSMIKPLQLAAGPADKDMANAVKKLLADVERIYSLESPPGSEQPADINQLGQGMRIDEATGDVTEDTYYGWSRKFCDKMKQRRNKANGGHDDIVTGRGRGSDRDSRMRSGSRYQSSSRESARPSFKRRRLSSVSGSRSQSRTRSRSRSRSRLRRYSRERYHRQSSRSRSRRRSPAQSRSPSRSRSRSQSYSPRLEERGPQPPGGHGADAAGQLYQPFNNPPPFPPAMPSQVGYGGFQVPPPPPPPPNYQGPWPPPPPPLLAPQGNPAQAPFFFGSNQQFMGGWSQAVPPPVPVALQSAVPPPPPPPVQGQGQAPYGGPSYGNTPSQGSGRSSFGFDRRW